MNLKNFLKENNIKFSKPLTDIFIFAVKDVFPTCYSGGKNQNWSDYKIVDYVAELDLSEDDLNKMLLITNRILKMKSFI